VLPLVSGAAPAFAASTRSVVDDLSTADNLDPAATTATYSPELEAVRLSRPTAPLALGPVVGADLTDDTNATFSVALGDLKRRREPRRGRRQLQVAERVYLGAGNGTFGAGTDLPGDTSDTSDTNDTQSVTRPPASRTALSGYRIGSKASVPFTSEASGPP
jgi:hypothetical protein